MIRKFAWNVVQYSPNNTTQTLIVTFKLSSLNFFSSDDQGEKIQANIFRMLNVILPLTKKGPWHFDPAAKLYAIGQFLESALEAS